ncbi:MAG: hypothetical protein PHU21_08260 [Elusimicrobia bacterium]|jgi:hypothetical protein|nr:hypothetical protein [Elusimicrobiota bacterium]
MGILLSVSALAAVLGAALGWVLGRRGAAPAERRAAGLQAQLDELAARPLVWEGRVELFDLLWFPEVTASPKTHRVSSVKAGLPHCRECAAPLSLVGGEWACAGCQARRPESVADVAVTDMIAKEALRQFLQRHPDYRAA